MKHGKYPLLAAFLLPALGLYGVFVLAPYAQAFLIAMTDASGLSNRYKFVGLDNFVALFKDEYFRNALWHNALLLVLLPAITILLGLFLASLLNVGGTSKRAVSGLRGSGFYKIIYFVPQVLSVAVIGVLWKEIYNPRSGILNSGLRAVGLDSFAGDNLGNPDMAFWLVLAVMVWANVGFYVVLFGAAMSSIPRDIYEAAALDGTSRWTTLFRITLPLVWDTVQVAWVYLAVIALDGFAIVQIMTRGGPNFSTDVAGQRMYDTAFTDSRFGMASAMGVVLFFFTLSVTLVALRLTKRERIELA
ncbi:carbohydrate ABC transporter permease [Catelliglobosispora koreensis]|uniref:carbohydrate ABC transporter permease n=1 Tax=Catelliglobosispora koreensis TaxID=129052 RepID=UPI0003777926|nr:sugar ABC transporter permease [Catelliglobosispora koreensis]